MHTEYVNAIIIKSQSLIESNTTPFSKGEARLKKSKGVFC